MDEEELQRRRERAALLRQHCQRFSRMGWALLAVMAAGVGLQLASVPLLAVFPGLAAEPLFYWVLSLASTYGLGFLLYALILRGVPPETAPPRRPLGPVRFAQVFCISVAALYLFSLLTQALLYVIGVLRGRPVENPVDSMLDFPLALNLLLACVAAPVCEELMFRKLLLDRLRPYGDAFAVLASALAFALLHGNLSQFFYAFALGCVFGYVALRTGCVWQTMLLHALVNGISAAVIPLAERFGELGVGAMGLAILAVLLLGIVFFLTLRRELWLGPGPSGLSEGRKWRLLFTSPGFLMFLLAFAAESAMVLAAY